MLFVYATGPSCKTRWGNIRDNFRKSLKKNKTVSGQRAKNTKQYKYSQQLTFLTKFFEERDTMTNIDFEVPTQENAGNDVVDEPGEYENEENSLDCTKDVGNPEIVESQSRTSSNLKQAECFTLPTPRKKTKQSVPDTSRSKTAAATVMEYLVKKNENIQPLAPQHPVDAFLSGIAPVLKNLPPRYWHYAKSDIFATVQNYEFKMIMEQDQSTEPPSNPTYSTRAYYEQPTTAAYSPPNLASISATSSFTNSPGDQSQDSSFGAFQQYD